MPESILDRKRKAIEAQIVTQETPQASPITQAPAATGSGTYVVQRGDSLNSIARDVGGDERKVQYLAAAIGWQPGNAPLQPGQTLNIPDWFTQQWTEKPVVTKNFWKYDTNAYGWKEQQPPALLNNLYGQSQQQMGWKYGPDVKIPSTTGASMPSDSYLANPQKVAAAYQFVLSQGAGFVPSVGFDMQALTDAYKMFETANKGLPSSEWKMPDGSNVVTQPKPIVPYKPAPVSTTADFNFSILDDATKASLFKAPGFDIAKYTPEVRQQMLADPSFNWDNLPRWQKWWYDLSSNAPAMGAATGAIFGGGIGGIVVGGAIGAIAGATGYDPAKKFYEQTNIFAKVLGIINVPAETAEQAIGFTGQVLASLQDSNKYGDVNEILDNPQAAWEAARMTYENAPGSANVLEFADQFLLAEDRANKSVTDSVWDADRLLPTLHIAKLAYDAIQNGDYAGAGEDFILGKRDPIEIAKRRGLLGIDAWQITDADLKLYEYRQQIEQGRPALEVMQEAQQTVGGQLGDMIGQGIFDPLNVMGAVESGVGQFAGGITGNDALKAAFVGDRQHPEGFGLREGLQNYDNYVTTKKSLAQLNSFDMFLSGLDKEGAIKELAPITGKESWAQRIATLTPQSRATLFTGIAFENITNALNNMTPDEFKQAYGLWSSGNMEGVRDMGATMFDTPEMYTILPAVKGAKVKMADAFAQYDALAGNREALASMADLLGQTPGEIIKTLKNGGVFEQQFARMVEKAKAAVGDADAAEFLRTVSDGSMNAGILQEAVKVFTETDAPYTEEMWKASTAGILMDHSEKWIKTAYKLAPDSAALRMFGLMKSVQNVVLLGLSPTYVINNSINNAVMLAYHGLMGQINNTDAERLLNNIGTPARMDTAEMGGETVGGASRPALETAYGKITNAARGSDMLQKANDAVKSFGDKVGIFARMSVEMEKVQSRQAFLSAMSAGWARNWSEGVGYKKMSAELERALNGAGIKAKDVYGIINGTMNQKELNAKVAALVDRGEAVKVNTRGMIDEVAQSLGVNTADSAELLGKMGMTEYLDKALLEATTPEEIENVFQRAAIKAQDWLAFKAAQDLKPLIDNLMQKILTEPGITVISDILIDMKMKMSDVWDRHGERLTNVFRQKGSVSPEVFSAMYKRARLESAREWQRIANYESAGFIAVVDSIGINKNDRNILLATITANQRNRRDFFKQRDKIWDAYYEGDVTNLDMVDASLDTLYKQMIDADLTNQATIDNLFIGAIKDKVGDSGMQQAADVFSQARDIYRERSQFVVDFRESLKDKSEQQRKAAWAEFWTKDNQSFVARLVALQSDGYRHMFDGSQDEPPTPVQPGPVTPPPLDTITPAPVESAPATVTQAAPPVTYVPSAYDLTLIAVKEKALKDLAPGLGDVITRHLRVMSQEITDQGKSIFARIVEMGGIPVSDAGDAVGEKNPFGKKGIPIGLFSTRGVSADFARMLLVDGGYLPEGAGLRELYDAMTAEAAGKPTYSTVEAKRLTQKEKATKAAIDRIIADLDNASTGQKATAAEQVVKAEAFRRVMLEWDESIDMLQEKVLDAGSDNINAENDLFDSISYVLDFMPDYYKDTSPEQVAKLQALLETQRENLGKAVEKWAVADEYHTALENVAQAEAEAATYLTREQVRQQMTEAFGSTPAEVDAAMAVLDARANVWAEFAESTPDAWYAEHIAEIIKGGESDSDLNFTAFHGSPYKFDKFSLDHLGSGEGAQAYGWGLYFAGDRSIAEWYRNTLSDRHGGRNVKYKGRDINQYLGTGDPLYRQIKAIAENIGYGTDPKQAIRGEQLTALEFADEARASLANPESVIREDTRQKGVSYSMRPEFPTELMNKLDTLRVIEDTEYPGNWIIGFNDGEKIVMAPKNFDSKADAENYLQGVKNYDNNIEWNVRGSDDRDHRFFTKELAVEYAIRDSKEAITRLEKQASDIGKINPNDFEKNKGQLYAVDLPDEHYLLWDKPLSQQPEAVQAALKGLIDPEPKQPTFEWIEETIASTGQKTIRLYVDGQSTQSEIVKTKTGWDIYGRTGYAGGLLKDVPDVEVMNSTKQQLESMYKVGPKTERTGAAIYHAIIDKNAKDYMHPGGWTSKVGSDKEASLALLAAGINGIKYLDGSSRSAGEGNYNYVIFDDAAVKILETFYQEQEGVKRGSVSYLDDGRAVIHALEAPNVVVFMHEVGHIFRRDLYEIASRTADVGLWEDIETVENWAGAKYGEWTRDAEEKFARGFEEYLATGDAPSLSLTRVFKALETWMLKMYNQITGSAIDVGLTDEMKKVFDRMLANDDERAKLAETVAQEAQAKRQAAEIKMQQEAAAKKASFTEPNTAVRPRMYPKPGDFVTYFGKRWEVAYADFVGEKSKGIIRLVDAEGQPSIKARVSDLSPYYEPELAAPEAPAPAPAPRVSPIVPAPGKDAEFYAAHPDLEPSADGKATVYKEPTPGTTKSGQVTMFGAGEDTPLFSGTTVKGSAETFTPKVNDTQPSMFPAEMKGAKPAPTGPRDFVDDWKQAQAEPAKPKGLTSSRDFVLPEVKPEIPRGREGILMDQLVNRIRNKEWFAKSRDFEAYIKNMGYNLDDELDLNQAYDVMEGAYNMRAREVRTELDNKGARLLERLKALDELEANLTEARRTLAKMELQQFSTPITIGEAAGWVADVRPGDVVGEPTAGNANLVDRFSQRADVTVRVNEIDPARRNVLDLLGYKPTALDMMKSEWLIQDGKRAGQFADVVISNPPWGSYGTGKYGTPINDPVKMNDWSQRFAYLTLKRMPEDGRYVGVMPTNWLYTMDRKTREITLKKSAFYLWLEKNYTIRGVIESPPGAYKQRGTDVGSLLIVIDKTPHAFDYSGTIEAYGHNQPKSWEEYAAKVIAVPSRTTEAVTHGHEQLKPIVAGPDASGIIDPNARAGIPESGGARIGEPTERASAAGKPGTRTPADTAPAQDARPGEQQPAIPVVPPDGIRAGGDGQVRSGILGLPSERDTVNANEPGQPVVQEKRPASPSILEGNAPAVSEPNKPRVYSDAFTQRLLDAQDSVRDSTSFARYMERAPLRDGEVSHPHPSVIVETKGLSSVPYPELEEAYRPSPAVMRAMDSRALSHGGNIDPIWQAVQQNDKHHMGILIADDVGMGKSRTAAGFVIDRIEKGKKKILVVTKGEQNVLNLQDEFRQVYGGKSDENGAYTTGVPSDFPAKFINLTGQNKKGEAIPVFDTPTVYFTTETSFRYYEPLLKDIGLDVFVADEAHMFKKVDKDTKYAVAWADLHKNLLSRDASIMYLTATPGIDLSELQYLYGLRAWSMDGFGDWIKIITGQESAEAIRAKEKSMKNVDAYVQNLQSAVELLDTPQVRKSWGYGIEQTGKQVGDIGVFYSDRGKGKESVFFLVNGEGYDAHLRSETQGILVAKILSENLAGRDLNSLQSWEILRAIRQATEDFSSQYPEPSRAELQSVGIKDASDVIARSDRGGWGKKGLSAFDVTLPPAHTEQIMREMKVAGSYMSRDISRSGVEFDVVEYKPTVEAKAIYNDRVQFYRELYAAWAQYSRMDKSGNGSAFGVNGDIQADAKRALFNMRLPGIIAEAKQAIANGEQVVISIISVGGVDDESGSLFGAVNNKINTQRVESLGNGEFSSPEEIPEAVLARLELSDKLKELKPMPSPIDALTDAFRDRIDFVHGKVDTNGRRKASKDFQNNKLDVIVISGAGKTGINLHDITGKRRVHLIVGDYEWSASTFKQELGRVDRTGELSAPKVTVMHTGSAGEKKFVATISNRMKGVGAVSKGGADSTGTGAMTDAFELGSALDKVALSEAWMQLSVADRSVFLDRFFREAGSDAPKATIEGTSASLSKFLLGLQSIEIDKAEEIFNVFEKKRAELIAQVTEVDDTAKASATTGDIIRQVDLAPNLRMSEVRNKAGQKFAVLDGVLTPHMNAIRGIESKLRNVSIQDLAGMAGGGDAWARWVQFYDPEKNAYATGLKINPGNIKDVAEHFGRAIGSSHTPENAAVDIRAGDRIKVKGANLAEWELYQGKAGSREGKIIVDGARLKDKDTLMANGASFNAIGNFFFVAEDNLGRFLNRFGIDNDTAKPKETNTLYYEDIPTGDGMEALNPEGKLPPNSYDQLAGWFPEGQSWNELFSEQVQPLLDGLKSKAKTQPVIRADNVKPETLAMLNRYAKQVNGDMATTKLHTMRFAETQRDNAMLNYSRKFGADTVANLVFPYQFWYTRSMANWAWKVLDRPAIFSNYYRLSTQMNRYEKDLPERLRGKVKIPMPFLPDWAGDSVYIDPMAQLFPFKNFTRPIDTMMQEQGYQANNATYILKEWQTSGEITNDEMAKASETKAGPVWERALAEAGIRMDKQISSPFDFAAMMFGPAWYLTTPLNLAGVKVPMISSGKKGDISQTNIMRTGSSLETATKDTPLAWLGQLGGLLASPERFAREKLGLQEYGGYTDYYIDRQLANMAADGMYSLKDIQKSMIERTGPIFDEAKNRVDLENMTHTPGALPIYAAARGDLKGAAAAIPGALMSGSILPEGELAYMGLKKKWNDAWNKYNGGDKEAINKFFVDHPEYEARLALRNTPEERLRQFMVTEVWDRYMALDKTDKRMVVPQLGRDFEDMFLNKETRSYESIPPETLATWTRILGGVIPVTDTTKAVTDIPEPKFPKLTGLPADIKTGITAYYAERDSQYKNATILQDMYYSIPETQKASRRQFVKKFPELGDYWDWKSAYLKNNPAVEPFISQTAAEEIAVGRKDYPYMSGQNFAQVMQSYWTPYEDQAPTYIQTTPDYFAELSPITQRQVVDYQVRGTKPTTGAMMEIRRIWETSGKPTATPEEFLAILQQSAR